jgi:hypothetical protein
MLPIAAWLLWKHPGTRVAAVAGFALHAVAVVGTGYSAAWIVRLVSVGGQELASAVNVAPSAVVGVWWFAAAAPLAVVAFRRGLPATSGLLLQPYWLPYYILMPLADLQPQLMAWCRRRR